MAVELCYLSEKIFLQTFYIELNLRNDKWLLNCSYNPHKDNIGNHLKTLSDF